SALSHPGRAIPVIHRPRADYACDPHGLRGSSGNALSHRHDAERDVSDGCINADRNRRLEQHFDRRLCSQAAPGGIERQGCGNHLLPCSPLLSQSTVPDPLAGTSMPSYSGCDHTNFSATSGTTNLTHGVYCGGIAISSVATVNLGAGDYIIVGGGLTVGNSAVLNGTTGVTILITGSATYPSAPFACTGAARVTLTAPTSGPHRALLFYRDRSANGTSAAANSIGNSCSATLTGTLYFPTP